MNFTQPLNGTVFIMRLAILVLQCDKDSSEANNEIEYLKTHHLSHLKHWDLNHSTIIENAAE
jgi:hypothetical protein